MESTVATMSMPLRSRPLGAWPTQGHMRPALSSASVSLPSRASCGCSQLSTDCGRDGRWQARFRKTRESSDGRLGLEAPHSLPDLSAACVALEEKSTQASLFFTQTQPCVRVLWARLPGPHLLFLHRYFFQWNSCTFDPILALPSQRTWTKHNVLHGRFTLSLDSCAAGDVHARP